MTINKLAARFNAIGGAPEGFWRAPGRVNLIGEHTDYNEGFVLPFALEQQAVIAAGRRSDDALVLASLELDEELHIPVTELAPGQTGWTAYLAGVVWALREAGHDVGGTTMVLTSDVPLGAGLSSSAAIECAAVTALAGLYGLEIPLMDRARIAQRAENDYVGAPTGILDQAASTLATAGHGLFMDCRTLGVVQVPLDFAARGLELLVLDTKTPHSHVDGEYGARRASCEAAARILGIPALRDVISLDKALAQLDDETLRKRVRHVVTENRRVLDAVEVTRTGDLAKLGPLLDASHASMRDDYEITVDTVDLAVETAKEHGAIGARMTGGGFGGCIIALCNEGEGARVAEAIERAFAAKGYAKPVSFLSTPSQGAGQLDC